MALSIVTTQSGAETGSASPTVSASWTPLEGDAVFVFLASTASDTSISVPAGWSEIVPGAVVDPGDTSMSMLGFTHIVTLAEQSASTTSWPLTNCWGGSPRAVDWIVVVVRGADPVALIDGSASLFQDTTASPFMLPGLAGAGLSTGSMVLSAVFADAFNRTYTTPSGWTLCATAPGTYSGGAVHVRDDDTVVGVDVPATSITPDVGDEYCAITVAVSLLGEVPNAAPTANAGANQSQVEPFTVVTLDGSLSSDPGGSVVDYDWQQTSGSPTVVLDGAGATRTFAAPATIGGVTLEFELTITDNETATDTSTCSVQILPHTWWLIDDGTPSKSIKAELL